MGALATVLPLEPVALEDSPYLLYLASLARGSIATQRCSLCKLLRETLGWPHEPERYPWHLLRYIHMAAIRTWIAERYAPSSANRILCALRGVLKQAYRLELISERDYRLAVDVPPVRGTRLPAGRAVTRGELRALFAVALERPVDARDVAILATLYGSGIRRAELCALDLDHLEIGSARPQLHIHGKGNKHRIVYPPAGTIAALKHWLSVRGREPGPLFCACATKARHLMPDRRISFDGVRKALKLLAKRTGVAHLTPHDLRRTFVGDLLDAGADLATVSKMAGHASVTTTARYDRRGERAKAEAADLLAVPFASPAAHGDASRAAAGDGSPRASSDASNSSTSDAS